MNAMTNFLDQNFKRGLQLSQNRDILRIYIRGGVQMQTQVKEWGNSQGVRIPKEALLEAGIDLNEILEMRVSKGVIMLEKKFRHRTLEERAQEFNGQLNLDGEFDWGEAVGREVW